MLNEIWFSFIACLPQSQANGPAAKYKNFFSHRVTRRRPFDPFGELRAGKLRAMAGQAENTERKKPFGLNSIETLF